MEGTDTGVSVKKEFKKKEGEMPDPNREGRSCISHAIGRWCTKPQAELNATKEADIEVLSESSELSDEEERSAGKDANT